MAKVTIEIEDNLITGKVKFTMTPSFETMMKKNNAGFDLTSAEAYAVAAANHVRKESKKQSGIIRFGVPKLQ